jgi:hypothetical protein
MPGPLATNRLTKAPAQAKHTSKHMRRLAKRIKLRLESFNMIKDRSGYHRPGSENRKK